MALHTMDDLKMRQALPLSVKVAMTKTRIREWVNYYGEDGVYISFSGGKDSTVLLDIVREDYPNIEAVFVDVPTQYPELKQFATSFPNVTVLHPKMGFAQVVAKYGFPFIGKEVALKVEEAKSKPNGYASKSFISEELGGRKAPYNYSRYSYLLNSKFSISGQCCAIMKKNPAKEYERKTGKTPIIATMASESMARSKEWVVHGCNAFDKKRAVSTPLATWTEQDVLLYIKEKNLPICSVYGEIVEDFEKAGQLDGQMSLLDFGDYDIETPPLKTTGCSRTGCVLCGFGAHCKDDTRFIDLKRTHPGLYTLLDKIQNNGVTMREAIEWINENGNLNIRL